MAIKLMIVVELDMTVQEYTDLSDKNLIELFEGIGTNEDVQGVEFLGYIPLND